MACCTVCSDICNCLNFKSSDNSILVNANKALCTWDLIANTVPSTLTYNSTTRVLTYTNEHGTVTNITLANDLQTLSLAGTVISLSKGGGSVDISSTFPIFAATSTSLVITPGGTYGNHPDIELVPSTDANNILTLGSDGHPFANYGTFAGVSSSLVITPGGTHGLTPHIELVPSIEANNALILGTDGKPYVPVTVIPTFAATSNSLVITPGGSHGSTPEIELVPSIEANNLLTLGTDGHPYVIDNAWKIIGNAGTNKFVNFLGTTDNVDLIFRRNNIIAGIINNSNTVLGTGSYNNTAIGANNTIIGTTSAPICTSASQNIIVGSSSLSVNITGSNNIVLGYNSLTSSTSSANIAIGTQVLPSNTTGIGNIGIGQGSLLAVTTGSYNIKLGSEGISFSILTTGNHNLLLGVDADVSGPTVSNSIALGNLASSSDNQLAVSPLITTIYTPGLPTGTGYVLTDVAGNGNLSLQPPPSPTGLTLTTTGTSGAATLTGSTLNVPNYATHTYNHKVDFFTATSGQTVFALSHVPSGDVAMFLTVSGALAFASPSQVSVTGSTLTYSGAALTAGSEVVFLYIY